MSAVRFRIIALILALCASACMEAAYAQFGGSGGVFGGRGGMPRGGDRGGRGNESAVSRDNRPTVPEPTSYEMIDYRLSVFGEDLKLTPPQAAAWQSFEQKAQPGRLTAQVRGWLPVFRRNPSVYASDNKSIETIIAIKNIIEK